MLALPPLATSMRCWRAAESSGEGAGKGLVAVEAGPESDLDDLAVGRDQLGRRPLKSDPKAVLTRRLSEQAPQSSMEVIRRQARGPARVLAGAVVAAQTPKAGRSGGTGSISGEACRHPIGRPFGRLDRSCGLARPLRPRALGSRKGCRRRPQPDPKPGSAGAGAPSMGPPKSLR